MRLALIVLAVVCCSLTEAVSLRKLAKPVGDMPTYTISGILYLPYAEIVEPFMAWYDETQFASRIDYYDGMVSTVQLAASTAWSKLGADFGAGIKISPMTDEEQTNVKTCFWVNGTEAAPVSIQSVLPDTTDFSFIGTSTWKGQLVNQYQSITQEGDKQNTYIYFTSVKTGQPIYYEMLGYDSLLGSHYDRYYIEYISLSTKAIPSATFAIPSSLTCRSFPGPGAQTRVSANPMREFMHNDMSHVHNQFADFKDKHSVEYNSEMEHQARLNVFKNNLRYIDSINRRGLSFRLAINHMADKSDEELAVLRGRQKSSSETKPVKNNGQPFDASQFTKDLPESFDWRLYGAVTPVKDQAVCGSCWSFGTAETIEGAYFVKHKKLVRLSPQNLIDCSWGFGNNGCDGGEDFRAYEWIIKHGGIATDASYGPYSGQNGYCHSNVTIGAQLTGYVNVTQYDATALKTALVNQGPISIGIDAAHKSLTFYANGVYYEPECGNKPDDLDHAVLLVGYGNIDDQDYWLVKNSWSTYWGNDGYVLMSQKDNNCGVTTDATYPLVV